MADGNMTERNAVKAAGTENLLPSRNLLAQVVEIQILPPERFKGEQKGEVVDIKKIGEVATVLIKVDDHYVANLYDNEGNLTEINLDPTSRELAQKTSKDYLTVRRDGDQSTYSEDLFSIFERLGFFQEQLKDLQEQWIKVSKKLDDGDASGDIRKSKVVREPPVYIPAGAWKVAVKSSLEADQMFVFSVGESYFAVKPVAPFAKHPLPKIDVQTLSDSETALSGDLRLEKKTAIFVISDKDGNVLNNYSGTKPHVDPADPNNLYFINTGGIYKLDLSGVADRTTLPVLERQIEVQDPKEIDFDPAGNFLIIRSGDQKLTIVDKKTGDVVRSFDQVKGPVLVDSQGDILFVDTQGKLREIQTNFQSISSGGTEAIQEKREGELRQMQERFANLELKKVDRIRAGQISEDTVAKTLRESIARQVTEKITTSTDPAEIEDILDSLQALKGDPANQAYGEVIDEFVGQAREKLSGIRTAEFDTQLGAYQQALDGVKSVGDTIGLDEQFAKLLELRQRIDVTDPQKRREIGQRLLTLQGKKDTLNNQYQGELVEAANQTLPQIEQLIKETGSTQELAYFSTSSQTQQFEMILANIKNPQVRKELRERYTAIRTEQRAKLEEKGRELAEQDRQRWAQVVGEAREDLASLREQVEQLSDAREIDRFGRNPLVTAWRAKLFALPLELREIEEKRLEIILGARKKDMEHRRELRAVGEAGELRFGNATFPVYKEPPRIWQPKLTPRKGGFSVWADLTFEDSQGRLWRPEGENDIVVSNVPGDERTARIVERYRKEADEYFRNIKRKVPEFDEHWRITGYHMGKLEEVAEALKLQLANHRGILLLQGEAGTGKNVLGDMLANLSNREIITVQCNENTVKEDLAYEFDFDPKTGTVRYPSRLIEGLQTPGAIIFLDEINALKPGIAKMMNSLFDYRRKLSFTAGGIPQEIIADPTVLFFGAMNPQNYAGVNRLSPEVKSRARVVDFDYPPFEEMRNGRSYYRSDEAEMLAAYIDTLGELKQKEFRQVWDYVINRDESSGGDILVQGNPQIETDVRRVYDVVRVANRLRDMYEAYQIGDSNEPMDFPTSLREVTDIVMEMNHRQGVKPMIKRVIIPKIDDRRQKRIVEATIDAVLPD